MTMKMRSEERLEIAQNSQLRSRTISVALHLLNGHQHSRASEHILFMYNTHSSNSRTHLNGQLLYSPLLYQVFNQRAFPSMCFSRVTQSAHDQA